MKPIQINFDVSHFHSDGPFESFLILFTEFLHDNFYRYQRFLEQFISFLKKRHSIKPWKQVLQQTTTPLLLVNMKES